MIEIANLTRTYPGNVQALKDISLTIKPGMFGLIGPNGAGKTSLMRILAGLLRPTSGSVQVFGHNLATEAGRRAVKALLGYLPQELGLYPTLSGREFLDYIAILKGLTNKAERQRQVSEVLERVRLSDVANRKLKTYSGGMKRRVGIAQALLGHPQLLIVDEPTVGLDPEERVRFRNLLGDISREHTVILSTHIIEDISQSCNDVGIIRQGQSIFHGSPGRLIEQARGQVWNIELANGERPAGELNIVSTIQTQHSTLFRVIGQPAMALYHPTPVEPSLEDSYIWLVRQTENPAKLTFTHN